MKNIIRVLAMGGGFVVGTQITNFLTTGKFFTFGAATPPAWTTTIKPGRPVFGLSQILVGGLVAAKAKQDVVRSAALGIAVSGGVDIVTQVLALVMPKLLGTPAPTAGYDMARVKMGRDMRRVPKPMGYDMPRVAMGGFSGGNPMLDSESSMG